MVCDRWERGTGLPDWTSTCHTCMWCDLGKSVWYWSCDIFSFLFDWSAHLDSGPFCWKPHLNRSSGSKVIWTIGRVLKTIENTKEIHSFYCLYLTINNQCSPLPTDFAASQHVCLGQQPQVDSKLSATRPHQQVRNICSKKSGRTWWWIHHSKPVANKLKVVTLVHSSTPLLIY